MTAQLHLTRHKGKLDGVPSINTSPHENEYCEVMSAVPGMVCGVCYARRLTLFRRTLERLCVSNGDLLRVYPMPCPVPRFNERYVRLHSFGELINKAHLMNFYDIAQGNPQTTFALWTKRRDWVQGSKRKRPDNMILIYSVTQLDPPERLMKVPKGFDHVYGVYTSGPECGDRCLSCLKCYSRGDEPRVIRQRAH
jgi:hypothetical protein